MKKHITFLILLLGFLSHGQDKPIVIYQEAPDRQKITEFEKRNDSLVISLENSGTNKVYLGDLRTDVSGKANIDSPTFTGNVSVPTATISDAAVNLGQMMDSLATVEVSSPIIWNESIGETIGPEANNNIFISDSTETVDKIFIVQNQANGNYTEDVGFTFITQGAGKIFIKGETGAGVTPVEVSTIGKAYALIRKGGNSWIPFGTSAPWDGIVNLYTLPNSANPDNEVDATTGAVAHAEITFISSDVDPQDGLYCLDGVNTTTGTARNIRFEIPISVLENGKTYQIKLYAKQTNQPTGNAWGILLPTWGHWESGATVINMISKGDWVEYTLTGTAATTTEPNRFLVFQHLTDTPIGTHVYIDNIRIYELE